MSNITLTHGDLRRNGREAPILEYPNTTEAEAVHRFLSLDDRIVGWIEHRPSGTRFAVRFTSSYELVTIFDDEFPWRLVRLYVVHSYWGNHAPELKSLV